MSGNNTWWTTYITPTVLALNYPDHRENENTFWGWYATAWMMCMFAMACDPAHDIFEYTTEEKHVWKILTACFYSLAIILIASGAVRYFRQQRALTQGTVLVNGVEIFIVAVAVTSAVVTVMATVIRYVLLDETVD